MEMLHIPNLTIAVLVFDVLLSLALPLGLMLVLRKKFHSSIIPFWVGCVSFFLAVSVLENLAHSLVLGSPAGASIQGNLWLYALYGGLMAGIFEETGRLAAMKLLKKGHNRPETALMYGAGHGGIEVLLVMGFSMLQNLVLAVTVNAGQVQTLLAPLAADEAAALESGIAALAQYSPAMFLLSPLERILAVTLHMTLSILVWQAAVKPGKLWLYFAAIGVHAFADASAVALQLLGTPLLAIEGWMALIDVAMVFWARHVYRKMKAEE